MIDFTIFELTKKKEKIMEKYCTRKPIWINQSKLDVQQEIFTETRQNLQNGTTNRFNT